MMKAPMAFREPGIPARTVPTPRRHHCRQHPSPFVPAGPKQGEGRSIRVNSWLPSPHFVAPALHQIAVDCTKLRLRATRGGGLLPGSRSTLRAPSSRPAFCLVNSRQFPGFSAFFTRPPHKKGLQSPPDPRVFRFEFMIWR